MITILVRGADGSELYETEFDEDYVDPKWHAAAILGRFTDANAFLDLDENRWYTEDGEEVIWFEEDELDEI